MIPNGRQTVKSLMITAILAAVLFALPSSLAAQSSACEWRFVWIPSCASWIPGCWCAIDTPTFCGRNLKVCWDSTPAPAGSADETALGPECCTAGEPINLANGNTYIEQKDARVPGLGGGLLLKRVWNSRWPSSQGGSQAGMFGRNWRFNYEERVFLGDDGTMKYSRGDGSFWSFRMSRESGTWKVIAPANTGAVLAAGSSTWIVTLKDGEVRTFNGLSGHLLEIKDRNGNVTTFTYDGTSRLTTVTDPASRHLYFGYADASRRLVTSVTSDVGVSLTYAYDSKGRLTTVTRPDSSTLSFEYDNQSLITAVKDKDGKILEAHTYDEQCRGLTSSRAGGVEALSVSYPQPPPIKESDGSSGGSGGAIKYYPTCQLPEPETTE